MSSPRLIAAAMALAFAVVPTTASAALSPMGGDPTPVPTGNGDYTDANGVVQPKWTADGILAPGESVGLDFPLADDQDPAPFNGGLGQLYAVSNFGDGSVDSGLKTFPASSGGVTRNSAPYTVKIGSAMQCGSRAQVRLAIGADTNIYYGIPTGVAGAYRRTRSYDVGNIIPEETSKESKVTVGRGGDLAKGIRVHLDSILHQYSTKWVKLQLKSPSGKTITLIEDAGTTFQDAGSNATRSFTNLTFSDYPVDGHAPVSMNDAITAKFKDVVIKPQMSFAAFDGSALTGDWKLIVTDKAAPLQNRSGGRGRALAGKDMIELGSWQLDTASALCKGNPEGWFGSDPLILNPAGDTIDASASVNPTLGGTITSYEWDLDGNGSFETTTTNPVVNFPATTFDGKREISLRVTDSEGDVSTVPAVRTAYITTPPTISSVTVNPANPIADQTVTITGAASDVETPTALTYSWDLDDNGTFDDKVGPSITHSWDQSGPKVVRLRVTDGAGASTYFNKALTVANMKPTAVPKVLTSPAIVGAEVTLSGAESSDVDGTIVKYSWDLDGDNVYDDVISADPTVKTVFSEGGVKIVGLQVTDNTNEVSDPITVQVLVTRLPQGVITATPISPKIGETVQFDAAGSADMDPGGSIVKYEWDLNGDGTYEVAGPAATTAARSYPNAGSVSIRLRLTDNDGAVSITPLNLLIVNPLGGSGGIPATTPKPPTTSGGGGKGSAVDLPKNADGNTVVPGVGTVPPGSGIEALQEDPIGEFLGSGGITENGFAAALSASAKQKAKKAVKAGLAVAVKTSDPGKITVKAMISVKDAKKLGLKIKKPTAIGSGKLVLKKKGTFKFMVVVTKKYAKYVKKAKKTPVSLVGVVTYPSGDTLAIARKVTISK